MEKKPRASSTVNVITQICFVGKKKPSIFFGFLARVKRRVEEDKKIGGSGLICLPGKMSKLLSR